MEKLNYKDLTIDDIVKISNEKLSEGVPFKELCKYLMTTDKTLKIHLNGFGYEYNSKLKQIEKVQTRFVTMDEFLKLQDSVKDLYKLLDKNTIKPVEGIKEFNGEFASKNFKIDVDVWERFNKFCKDNRQYKVQDIINSVLSNFLDDMQS
ncbi:MAG: hypothetical protein ACRC5M_02800 [Anaeroplasmataceae bacterium]